MKSLHPAVFFDKDGTLIENVPYNVDCTQIQLAPTAIDAARQLSAAGYRIVVVSNQPGIARGYVTMDAVLTVADYLRDLLAIVHIPLAGFYFCPHHPQGSVAMFAQTCTCRKPAPGLLHQAAADLRLELSQSWMVGDILDDIEAGHRAGCRSVLCDVGNETEWQQSPLRTPDAIVSDLAGAAEHILSCAAAGPLPRPILRSGSHPNAS